MRIRPKCCGSAQIVAVFYYFIICFGIPILKFLNRSDLFFEGGEISKAWKNKKKNKKKKKKNKNKNNNDNNNIYIYI